MDHFWEEKVERTQLFTIKYDHHLIVQGHTRHTGSNNFNQINNFNQPSAGVDGSANIILMK